MLSVRNTKILDSHDDQDAIAPFIFLLHQVVILPFQKLFHINFCDARRTLCAHMWRKNAFYTLHRKGAWSLISRERCFFLPLTVVCQEGGARVQIKWKMFQSIGKWKIKAASQSTTRWSHKFDWAVRGGVKTGLFKHSTRSKTCSTFAFCLSETILWLVILGVFRLHLQCESLSGACVVQKRPEVLFCSDGPVAHRRCRCTCISRHAWRVALQTKFKVWTIVYNGNCFLSLLWTWSKRRDRWPILGPNWTR